MGICSLFKKKPPPPRPPPPPEPTREEEIERLGKIFLARIAKAEAELVDANGEFPLNMKSPQVISVRKGHTVTMLWINEFQHMEASRLMAPAVSLPEEQADLKTVSRIIANCYLKVQHAYMELVEALVEAKRDKECKDFFYDKKEGETVPQSVREVVDKWMVEMGPEFYPNGIPT